MDRRDVLERVCLAGATAFVAGRVGEYGGGATLRVDSSSESDDESEAEERQPCRGERPQWAEADPYEHYEISDDPDRDSTDGGEGERVDATDPYHVWIRNVTDETRSLAFVVSDGAEPLLEEDVDLPAGEYLELEVFDREHVGIRLESAGSLVETSVSRPGDAGSRSRTTITVDEGGIRTESETVQRSVAGVDVDETSFDTLERSCAGGDVGDATVSLEGSTVVVEGSVETPTPCHALSLSEATIGDDGVLEVMVAVDDQEDEACVQCVGEIEYEARVEATDAPGSVRVIHEAGDEQRVAASVVCAD